MGRAACSRQAALVIGYVPSNPPRDYSFYRRPCTGGTVATVLQDDYGMKPGAQTFRLAMHEAAEPPLTIYRPAACATVWAPAYIGTKGSQRLQTLRRIRAVAASLPVD